MKHGLIVVLLAGLASDATAHQHDWWNAYQEKAERWQQTLQDNAERLRKNLRDQGEQFQQKLHDGMQQLGEQVGNFDGLGFCDCDTTCRIKTQPLVVKLKRMEQHLHRCDNERRQGDLVERERFALETKLSICEDRLEETSFHLNARTAQLELVHSLECIEPTVADCPEVSCESLDSPSCPECPCTLQDEHMHRHLAGAMLFSALMTVFAIRCWLRARCLSEHLKVLKPAFAAGHHEATPFELDRADVSPSTASQEQAWGEFSCSVNSKAIGDGTASRQIRIKCPGVVYSQVHIEGRPNGCLVTIQPPAQSPQAGAVRGPWARLFQFGLSEGHFEFQKELAHWELGILTLVFVASSEPPWVFRFPERFDLDEGDKEMAWMLSKDSALPAEGPPEQYLKGSGSADPQPISPGDDLELEYELRNESAEEHPSGEPEDAAVIVADPKEPRGPPSGRAVTAEAVGLVDISPAGVKKLSSSSSGTTAAFGAPDISASATLATEASVAFETESSGDEEESVSDQDCGSSAPSEAGRSSEGFMML